MAEETVHESHTNAFDYGDEIVIQYLAEAISKLCGEVIDEDEEPYVSKAVAMDCVARRIKAIAEKLEIQKHATREAA